MKHSDSCEAFVKHECRLSSFSSSPTNPLSPTGLPLPHPTAEESPKKVPSRFLSSLNSSSSS
ncbi:hypothetical protein E2C01_050576 [Portunus trituberculatus]|uniref:Uncharacterized protein n=1 Tax=Portunus trituberculatus TaxID=210409 RepID=A0A5B7GCH5_PORTR|nr:hypothetical protein [Portunus trituberculatus]